jgi:hypothetical protein
MSFLMGGRSDGVRSPASTSRRLPITSTGGVHLRKCPSQAQAEPPDLLCPRDGSRSRAYNGEWLGLHFGDECSYKLLRMPSIFYRVMPPPTQYIIG